MIRPAAPASARSLGARRLSNGAGARVALWTGLAAAALAVLATSLAVSAIEGTSNVAVFGLLVLGALAVAAVVGSLRTVLLSLVVLDVAFQWDTNVNWRPDAAEAGATAGLSISLTTLALAGLYALWFAELLARARPATQPTGTRLAVPLLFYVGFSALSLLAASDLELAQFKLFVLVQSLLLFIYVAGTVRTVRDIRLVVGMLMIGLLAQGVLVLVGRFAGLDLAVAGLSTAATESQAGRFGGTVGSPTTAAAFFSFLLAPAIAVLVSNAGRWSKRIAAAALVVGMLGLVFTLSRGGWIAGAIAIALFVALAWRRGWLRTRWLVIGTVAFVLLIVPFVATIGERVTGPDGGSAESRLPLIELSLDMIEDQPVQGVGLNNYTTALPDYAGPTFTGEFLFAAHNKYLLVWAEAGLFALLAFIAFLLVTLRRGWLAGLSAHPYVAPIAVGFTFAIVGQMVHMTVEIFQSRPQVQLLWLAAALLAAMSTMSRRATMARRARSKTPQKRARPPVAAGGESSRYV